MSGKRNIFQCCDSLKESMEIKCLIDTYFYDGRKSREIGIARQSLKEGLSVELISKLTGLSKDEIEKL